MEVLGRSVPGNSLFYMGSGADKEAFQHLEPWGITDLETYNKVMRRIIGEQYEPVADVGRLSYYECMISDLDYIETRRNLRVTLAVPLPTGESAEASEVAGLAEAGESAVAGAGVDVIPGSDAFCVPPLLAPDKGNAAMPLRG